MILKNIFLNFFKSLILSGLLSILYNVISKQEQQKLQQEEQGMLDMMANLQQLKELELGQHGG